MHTKTKYMLMYDYKNTRHNHYIKTVTNPLKIQQSYKYLGATLRNKCCTHEEINSRLNSGNACYHSVENLLSSGLLSAGINWSTQNYFAWNWNNNVITVLILISFICLHSVVPRQQRRSPKSFHALCNVN